ncbi:MAG: STAS domain-containing protein [Anaerolineae bacterium]|jgi:anti-anti-sigma regulatory factor|nr:STAS domain-containing protein [Anaerolineae bacterium]
MNLTVEHLSANKPVTVLKIQGELDGSSYQSLIQEAQKLYNAGTRYLLLDLSDMNFISSAGLVGLHSVVTVMRGKETPDMEGGWSVIHEASHDMSTSVGPESACKLVNPQPRVQKTLSMTGFDQLLEIYTDRDTAVASF